MACGECRDCVERKGRNCQNFRLHKFRYTYARVLDEGKTPIEDIRKALGHKDISTTIGYLGGGDKSQRRANIERSFPRRMGEMLIGVDYHSSFQTIAFFVEETGECGTGTEPQ